MLINADPVDFEADGAFGSRGVAADCADGLVQDDVHRFVNGLPLSALSAAARSRWFIDRPSSRRSICFSSQSIVHVWKLFGPGLAAEFGDGLLYGGPFVFSVQAEQDVGQDGAGKNSMMSISPPAGHPTRGVAPSVQNAGQFPSRVSMRARISNLPYRNSCRPRVVRLADE